MTTSARRRESLIAFAVFAAAAIAGFAFALNSTGLPLDDAYIHLAFARNLGTGRGFCFNPGQPSLGFSSPLWVMIMAAMQWLGAGLVRAARNLSLIFSAGSAALLYLIVRASLAGRGSAWVREAVAVLSAILFITCGNMLWLAASGMEAPLFLFLGLAAIIFLRPDGPRPVIGGVMLGLALLTRIEAAGLWIAVAAMALAHRPGRRRILPAFAVGAVVAAPWFIFSFFRTGFLVPHTRAGKLASAFFSDGFSAKGIAAFIYRHLVYLWRFDQVIALLLVISAFAAVSIVGKRIFSAPHPDRPSVPPLLTTTAGALILWAMLNLGAHALTFRSSSLLTPYNNLRYQVMLIPAIIAAAALGLSRFQASLPRPRAMGLLALFILAGALALEMSGLGDWHNWYSRQADQLQKEHRAAAEWARAELPPDARIAALDIGALGFYSGRYVIDLGGLIDPSVLPDLRRHRTGPYLVKMRATHYFHLIAHDSDKITGVMAGDGTIYRLRPIKSFPYPPFFEPVFLHSFGIVIYRVMPPPAE